MVDRTTKVLLAAIALGLWVNVVGDWLRPVELNAQADTLLQYIRADLDRIARGVCTNTKIC